MNSRHEEWFMKISRVWFEQNGVSALALGAALLIPAAALAQKISTDYDHNADFSTFHTYTFDKIQTHNPLNVQRVKDAVSRDLGARGMHEVPTGGDVTITAIGETKTDQEYNTFYDGLGGRGFGWGGGWRSGFGGGFGGDSSTTVQQIPVGTLMLDMYNGGSHQLVWRGTATADISSNADKNAKELNKSIDKMFDKFPPKGAH